MIRYEYKKEGQTIEEFSSLEETLPEGHQFLPDKGTAKPKFESTVEQVIMVNESHLHYLQHTRWLCSRSKKIQKTVAFSTKKAFAKYTPRKWFGLNWKEEEFLVRRVSV